MYLNSATDLEDILEYGIKPLILFTDALEASRSDEDNEEADLYQLEIKARLYRIQERIRAIVNESIAKRKEREAV